MADATATGDLTRDDVIAKINQMCGDSENARVAYAPIVDLAFGMAGSSSDEYSDPSSTQRAEIVSNLRFAANEIRQLADELEKPSG